jgi:hypothetical protein
MQRFSWRIAEFDARLANTEGKSPASDNRIRLRGESLWGTVQEQKNMEVRKMASRYQHRIGVRAGICFDLTVDVRNPTPQELSQLVSQALKQAAENDGGFKVNTLPGGIVYPDWNSMDPELEPDRVLDPETIRIFDCTEASSIH